MDYYVALLVFGVLLLLLGLVGKVKAKELEVGTSNVTVRIVTTLVGSVLIVLSFVFNPGISLTNVPGFADEEVANDAGSDSSDDQDSGAANRNPGPGAQPLLLRGWWCRSLRHPTTIARRAPGELLPAKRLYRVDAVARRVGTD